jgi:hypothetical protein
MLPSIPEPPQYQPEQSVGRSKSRLRASSHHDSKLLPNGQIL